MRTLKPACEYLHCEKEATVLVYSRNENKVLICCPNHAETVAREDHPEYTHSCENCGCVLPIN